MKNQKAKEVKDQLLQIMSKLHQLRDELAKMDEDLPLQLMIIGAHEDEAFYSLIAQHGLRNPNMPTDWEFTDLLVKVAENQMTKDCLQNEGKDQVLFTILISTALSLLNILLSDPEKTGWNPKVQMEYLPAVIRAMEAIEKNLMPRYQEIKKAMNTKFTA